ncbi:MAG TPA: hypothetical protein DD401_01270 [Prevotella sp.]|nr:hypothetical protein [Prevotella sp.]
MQKISTKHQTYTFNLIQFDMIKIKKKPWLAILPAILSLFFISCNNSDNDSETNNLKRYFKNTPQFTIPVWTI